MKSNSKNEIRELVMDRYKKIAVSTDYTKESKSNCCSSTAEEKNNCISAELGYSVSECGTVPIGSNLGLGCGNPQAIAELKLGETVLDLGSGGGFDCFLASKSVGSKGNVIGVDMTPEMISLSRRNAVNGNYSNTEFRLGEIEHLPVADATIDVIMSNCVINLSPEKEKVFAEAFRVLKPGGKLALADVVLIKPLSSELKSDASLYSGCVAGALSIEDLELMLRESGFSEIAIVPKYKSREFIKEWIPGKDIENYIVSATIKAFKKM